MHAKRLLLHICNKHEGTQKITIIITIIFYNNIIIIISYSHEYT